jgi:GNAT superfamily N-acetyltransferase
MKIDNCTQKDFQIILSDISYFWGNDRTLEFHHPIFIYEFADSAFVVRENDTIIAYLFGFISQTRPTAYVHLIGVRENFQKNGLGTMLYQHFITYAKNKGCNKLKAITTPANHQSISFHKKIGMQLLGEKNENGIEIIKDYSGPGQDRVVFEMEI